jgi:hypothetical protein
MDLTTAVYIQYITFGFSFPKRASARPEGLIGLVNSLIQLLFPCQSLV